MEFSAARLHITNSSFMSLHRNRLFAGCLAGVLFVSASITTASPLDETVTALEQWVETERSISETKTQWESDRSSMKSLISIYEREIEVLTEAIAEAEKDTSAAEIRRAELNRQNKEIKDLEAEALELIKVSEAAVKTLGPVLPPPLRKELQPLFTSIPENPDDSKLAVGQRIQPIVAILTQVQKFNQVVTLVEDFREFEAGRTVQTETVYFGLGAAYYVDQVNENAGYGVIGPDGWEWKADNALIPAVRSFVDIYRGTQQARYVELPISLN